MTDRPLSMTELQAIRAALEAADNYCAAVDLAGSGDFPEMMAGLTEHVHRAMTIIDRRIKALNAASIKHHAGDDAGDDHDPVTLALAFADVERTLFDERGQLDPDDAAALHAGLTDHVPVIRLASRYPFTMSWRCDDCDAVHTIRTPGSVQAKRLMCASCGATWVRGTGKVKP